MGRKLRVDEMGRLSVPAYRGSAKAAVEVVLDDVRSMYNVGSIFRTADAYRLGRLHLCGITACPPAAEIHKTALGAEDTVEWERHESALEAVASLHRRGVTVLAVEQARGSVAPWEYDFRAGSTYALVLGNEVKGVSQAVVDAADGILELPQYGTKHSLNVAVTAGIVIHEATRRLPAPPAAIQAPTP